MKVGDLVRESESRSRSQRRYGIVVEAADDKGELSVQFLPINVGEGPSGAYPDDLEFIASAEYNVPRGDETHHIHLLSNGMFEREPGLKSDCASPYCRTCTFKNGVCNVSGQLSKECLRKPCPLRAGTEPTRDWPSECAHGVSIGKGPCLSCRLADLALEEKVADVIVGPGFNPGPTARRKAGLVLALFRAEPKPTCEACDDRGGFNDNICGTCGQRGPHERCECGRPLVAHIGCGSHGFSQVAKAKP